MKPVLVSALATLLLTGCATATRTSLPANEATCHYVLAHSQPSAQAFNSVELALARIYALPAVLTLRQSETGTLVLKPLVQYEIGRLGAGFGNVHGARYTLQIIVREGTITMDFALGPDEMTGTYAPKSEMPLIEANFEFVVAQVVRAVNGTLKSSPALQRSPHP